MDIPQPDQPADPETAVARHSRIAREAKSIAEARASAAAGRVVSLEAVEAWVDSWDTGQELPTPQPRART